MNLSDGVQGSELFILAMPIRLKIFLIVFFLDAFSQFKTVSVKKRNKTIT